MTTSIPQARYRWVIVIASALILAISMGAIVNGMSAFIVPMQMQFGWPRGQIALINFAGIMGLAFGGLFMGPLADRKGTRPLVMFGVAVLGLCYLAAAFMTALWQFYLLFFIAGFFGAAAIFPPVMAAVGNWFFVGAGMAIGIASAGQAMGQGGVPFVSSFLIKAIGISGAFWVTGVFMLVTLLPLSLLLRQPPSADDAQRKASAAEEETLVPTNTVIITMSAAIILCCTCMSTPLMHLVPLIQDCGFAAEQAGSVIFVMLLVAIAGRLAFGKLADVIGAVPAYMTATAWMTALVFGFIYIDNLSLFYVYGIIYGFGYAGVMTGVLVSLRMLTPPSRRAQALGIVTMFGWFGHAIGGYQGGALYDLTGNYTAAFAVAAIAGVLNLIIVSTLLRKTRRARMLAA
ncbi:MFS transporter [Pseudosulfitobacter pseudonitzschiae]|uniref:MFS transporter n=1 Tax=Pseudosulfitobacter pseudonitzschiae TaxID=1402135 RepID=UPI001AF55CBB|nr:MFS transporter [Pseudosulfitobacter pseudonitzschiae]MBM1814699.1 MFS transporter [Pseudosulfitobacter pseudonitzschiae]MBM1831693.1 MFS transporter [Pseudosulfitobacter pseudonitzschiae]MBM1836558.1 MFS transporter [Pseudosulfitobacter pseudonitzschiae]MBM1841405.1 MFS transporter [Pseudosulfitobacter pseudonitzschiae]MBM1846272.1 MFS transporter [Pseudosulfitobacter pseudonitzschiae]